MKFNSLWRRLLSVMCAAAVLICLFPSAVRADGAEKKYDPITDGDYLSVRGSILVTSDGEPVLLRGVNLGGWMIQESWMCPVEGADKAWANMDSITTLESRGFTAEQIQTIFDTYQDNYITEEDLDFIASLGCNVVRVPFWYRNFMLDEEGTWIDDDLGKNPGFKRLDWIVNECGKRGMYVILDMHGCPGGQSTDHCCGTLARNELYSSETCQSTMEKLWVAIADRYKNNPAVAAYDIMNEPQNNSKNIKDMANYYDPWDESSWEASNEVYKRMIKAVREVDPNHVISVEGIWRVTNLPDPDEMGWYNMLYQVHLYDGTEDFKKYASQTAAYAQQYGVAAYVGEFSNIECIDYCNEIGINWTTWTYKGGRGANGTWFCVAGSPSVISWSKDDYDTIIEKCGDQLRTGSGRFGICTQVAKAVSNGAKAEYVPPAEQLDVESEWFNSVAPFGSAEAGEDAGVSGSFCDMHSCVKLVVETEGDPGTEKQCVVIRPQTGDSFDASEFSYLIFSVKDTQGANSFRLTVVDTEGEMWDGWVDELPEHNKWSRIAVPLSMVTGVNKRSISEIRIGEWNPGTYYFDEVFFASSPDAEAPESGINLTALISAAAVAVMVIAAVCIVIGVVRRRKNNKSAKQEN